MIQAHALDAWTRAADRSSKPFGYLMVLGGFAAPLFLWLAGVGLVLSAEQARARGISRATATKAVVQRGAEIFILAFLFRIQAFIVSPGSHVVTIFRVDILNVMGPAIATAGLIWGLTRGRRLAALGCGAAATLLAMMTPVLRTAEWVGELPLWLQWYIRPFGDNTTFTLFPWAGFLLAGAAYGSLLAPARDNASERRTTLGLTLSGAAVLSIGLYTATLSSIYTSSSFWTSSPTFFAVRCGVMMLLVAALYWIQPVARIAGRGFAILETFGRNSLFVYWIHVELVYGYTTWAIHRRLPLAGTAVAYILFCCAMFAAIRLKKRLADWWKTSRSHDSAPNRPVAARA